MKKGFKAVVKLSAYLFLAGCLVGAATQPLSAQVTIPQGATITSAVFSVYHVSPWIPNNQMVYVHRITQDWGECSVNYANFGNHYDPTIWGSFAANGIGWLSTNLTALVQAWYGGVYPNYGIAIVQAPDTAPNVYWSSEYANPLLGPKLVITYTYSGQSFVVTIPPPSDIVNNIADVFISEQWPLSNECAAPSILTGHYNGLMKYSLIRFNLNVEPPHDGPGTGTPGYWMNHPEAWPVPSIIIGGREYSRDLAISLMKASGGGDKTYTMFQALVAAKLNVLIGCEHGCIDETIAAADNWMTAYFVGSGVSAGGATSPWRIGEALYAELDAYNNGLLCAPHRD